MLAVRHHTRFRFHLDDRGLAPPAALCRRTAMDETRHAWMVAEGALFLNDEVDMTVAGEVERITDPARILPRSVEPGDGGHRDDNRAARERDRNSDSTTRQLFGRLATGEERRFDEFDRQKEDIERHGPSCLALRSFAAPSGEGEAGAV